MVLLVLPTFWLSRATPEEQCDQRSLATGFLGDCVFSSVATTRAVFVQPLVEITVLNPLTSIFQALCNINMNGIFLHLFAVAMFIYSRIVE